LIYLFIRLLVRLGLAWNVVLPSRAPVALRDGPGSFKASRTDQF